MRAQHCKVISDFALMDEMMDAAVIIMVCSKTTLSSWQFYRISSRNC